MKSHKPQITIIGDGGWGTTLAVYLARRDYAVTLWGAFPEYIQQVRESRVNRKFLPGVEIPHSVKITSDLKDAIEDSEVIVLAVPSQYLRSVLRKLKKFNLKKRIILSVVKGIETTTLMRVSEIIKDVLGKVDFAVLSGPTIAGEVARGVPSTAVIASQKIATARVLQKIFNSETFRIYTNRDVAGVEIGGSLKNVIAISCGVCDGLGYGTNTKAAIVTRGLAEISRLGKAMGAKRETFAGLTGLGDLITTCFSPQSRNRSVGEAIGKGSPVATVLNSMSMVAEGVDTAKAVTRLSQKHGIPMPISQEVYLILFKGKSPKDAVAHLMRREAKAE